MKPSVYVEPGREEGVTRSPPRASHPGPGATTVRRMVRRLFLFVVLALLPACKATRAEFGFGLGLGADVHLSGALHTGLLASRGIGTYGPVYGKSAGGRLDYTAVTLGLFHYEYTGFKRAFYEHSNLGVAPPLTTGLLSRTVRAHPWAFELTIAPVFCLLRVGFDPMLLFEPDPVPRPIPDERVEQKVVKAADRR